MIVLGTIPVVFSVGYVERIIYVARFLQDPDPKKCNIRTFTLTPPKRICLTLFFTEAALLVGGGSFLPTQPPIASHGSLAEVAFPGFTFPALYDLTCGHSASSVPPSLWPLQALALATANLSQILMSHWSEQSLWPSPKQSLAKGNRVTLNELDQS